MFLKILVILIVSPFIWKTLIPLLRIILCYTIGIKYFSKRHLLRQAGEWAVITGGSAGIGRAYADELAKDGLNIVLLGNDLPGLTAAKREIEERHKVKVIIIEADFTEVNMYPLISEKLHALSSIACLVNNVGMFYPPHHFLPGSGFVSLEFCQKLIYCNMVAATTMTRIVLPKMLKQRPMGAAIINLSSRSAWKLCPYMSLYAASKQYIYHFSQCLRQELSDSGILVQTVCPSVVATSMTKIEESTFLVPDARTVASSALDLLGVECNTSGYIGHSLAGLVLDYLPACVTKRRIQAHLKKYHSR
ncbi:Very-long-chain 3-oxoacyl-CoA reductase [Paragonimus heterotremus]|uniref:Very-long-chain 3-oxoacyl-CoA reductase n=1 Tax=Paragonimus heterotremus TaxID=100268 RepID=A0A8J4SKP0_9TREM|nr:Very-long-chain 3-oxoacyl-CoA reductase [Paragonimus heterotremus]